MSMRRRKYLAWLLWSTTPGAYDFARTHYRIGERLRPCPDCPVCCDNGPGRDEHCDGSGVLPARRAKS